MLHNEGILSVEVSFVSVLWVIFAYLRVNVCDEIMKLLCLELTKKKKKKLIIIVLIQICREFMSFVPGQPMNQKGSSFGAAVDDAYRMFLLSCDDTFYGVFTEQYFHLKVDRDEEEIKKARKGAKKEIEEKKKRKWEKEFESKKKEAGEEQGSGSKNETPSEKPAKKKRKKTPKIKKKKPPNNQQKRLAKRTWPTGTSIRRRLKKE